MRGKVKSKGGKINAWHIGTNPLALISISQSITIKPLPNSGTNYPVSSNLYAILLQIWSSTKISKLAIESSGEGGFLCMAGDYYWCHVLTLGGFLPRTVQRQEWESATDVPYPLPAFELGTFVKWSPGTEREVEYCQQCLARHFPWPLSRNTDKPK